MIFDLYLAAFVARPESDLTKVFDQTLHFTQEVCSRVGHEWVGPTCGRCRSDRGRHEANEQLTRRMNEALGRQTMNPHDLIPGGLR